MLQAIIERVKDTARINYFGDTIDIPYGPLTEIADLIDRGVNKLLINMKDVEYLNSSGISTLISTVKLVQDKDGKMAIYNLQPQVEKVIRLTRMESLLSCFDDEVEAAQHVGMLCGESAETKRDQVIVVEFNLEISKSLKSIFEEFKQLQMYEVVSVSSLDEAVQHLKSSTDSCVILMDVNCEPIKSLEFLEIVKLNRESRNIPVIVVTREENAAHAHYLIRNGADDMLRFPFNKYETATRLRNALFHSSEVEYIAKSVQGKK